MMEPLGMRGKTDAPPDMPCTFTQVLRLSGFCLASLTRLWYGPSREPRRKMSTTITWSDFEKIEIRVGTIVRAEPFPEARKPAYRLWVDLGELGVKQSSAQITALYTPEQLVGTQVVAVTNFPPKQIGPFISEVLVTGFVQDDGSVILARPDKRTPNGSRLA
jgi:tRNA-binding protein